MHFTPALALFVLSLTTSRTAAYATGHGSSSGYDLYARSADADADPDPYADWDLQDLYARSAEAYADPYAEYHNDRLLLETRSAAEFDDDLVARAAANLLQRRMLGKIFKEMKPKGQDVGEVLNDMKDIFQGGQENKVNSKMQGPGHSFGSLFGKTSKGVGSPGGGGGSKGKDGFQLLGLTSGGGKKSSR